MASCAREWDARLVAAILWWLVMAVPVVPSAQEQEERAEGAETGPMLHSAVGARVVPVGLTMGNDLGYRWSLFDSDSLLLEGTWFEPGLTTEITPSNGWVGAYVESVPLSLLKLRASFQSIHYFGTYGYLHVPESREDAAWALEQIDDDFASGVGSRGWMARLAATPRVKAGSFVALAETSYRWIEMAVEGPYYESTFDMLLEPTDAYWKTTPTAGGLFEFSEPGGYLLLAGGWEYTATVRTQLTRQMARLLALWGLPWRIDGRQPELAVLGGYWVDHPNRSDTWYLAGQFSVDWSL